MKNTFMKLAAVQLLVASSLPSNNFIWTTLNWLPSRASFIKDIVSLYRVSFWTLKKKHITALLVLVLLTIFSHINTWLHTNDFFWEHENTINQIWLVFGSNIQHLYFIFNRPNIYVQSPQTNHNQSVKHFPTPSPLRNLEKLKFSTTNKFFFIKSDITHSKTW